MYSNFMQWEWSNDLQNQNPTCYDCGRRKIYGTQRHPHQKIQAMEQFGRFFMVFSMVNPAEAWPW